MDLNLKGRWALITGGSRGIGYGAAYVLAGEGCNLHLASRSAADLETARNKILAKYHVEIVTHALDLSKRENMLQLAKEVGDIDILINNAGTTPHGTIDALEDEPWREAWNLKLFGYINLTREIYRDMCARKRGVICNVIGISGERPFPSNIAGSMGNAALIAMTRALGSESLKHGVRVVAVNPGGTETDRQVVRWEALAKKQFGDASRWRELTKDCPGGRLATLDEVGSMIAFLCSDRSNYTTGTIVTIDGGFASMKP